MTLFARTHTALIAGEVICDISHPDLYQYLVDDEGLESMNSYLARVDQKVGVTRSGRSLCLFHADGSEAAKQAITADAKGNFEDAFKVRSFVELMLKVNDVDGVLRQGMLVRFQTIAVAVDASTATREELTTVASVFGLKPTTDQTRISGVLKKLADMGYLKLVRKEQEDYIVTGKIDLWRDIEECLVTRIGPLQDVADEAEQMALDI